MIFVYVPAGTFDMGSKISDSNSFDRERPVRKVQITKAFYLGKYEVTQEQYVAVMGKNPSHFKGDKLPVEQVSWEDAMAFCKQLGEITGRSVRLPTEAEWEYAARGCGQDDTVYAGSENLDKLAWFKSNSNRMTHAVGRKKPNELGLYDMSGNVWEWCQDWYAGSYNNASMVDPKGPVSGTYRVLRGGGWDYPARLCRSASRGRYRPDLWNNVSGFRVALE